MGVSVLLRLFISSNEVYNTAYALLRIHEQNSISKYTTLGPVIPKKMKYNLHHGDLNLPTLSHLSCCWHSIFVVGHFSVFVKCFIAHMFFLLTSSGGPGCTVIKFFLIAALYYRFWYDMHKPSTQFKYNGLRFDSFLFNFHLKPKVWNSVGSICNQIIIIIIIHIAILLFSLYLYMMHVLFLYVVSIDGLVFMR